MSDFVWPDDIVPNSTSWRLVSNTGAFSSPLSGQTRTIGRGGDRWACTLQFVNRRAEERARIASFLSRLRGQAHRVVLGEFAYQRRGSFPTGELITNISFDTSVSPWTSSDVELALSVDTHGMRAYHVGATADRTVRHPGVTVTNAVPYLLRAGVEPGRGEPSTIRWSLRMGTTAGANDIVQSATFSGPGYSHVHALASGTTLHPSIVDIWTGRVAGDYLIYQAPSLSRAILVMGGSQSGSTLDVDGLPATTTGLLLAGDFVSIFTAAGWGLYQVTHNLNSDGSGVGHIAFTPPLRDVPADNAPIAVHRPWTRFLLADPTVGWSNLPGIFSDFSVDFVEDLT